jgi:hypothetical protein
MASNETVASVKFKFKHLVAALAVMLSAVALIWWVDSWSGDFKTEHAVAKVVIDHIAAALVIAAVWHAINEFFLKRDFLRINDDFKEEVNKKLSDLKVTLSNEIGSARKDAKLGLIDTFHDVAGFSYSEFIAHPQELTILLSDGYNWVSTHIDALRARIQDPTKKTKFFLVHPDSPMVSVIALKVGEEPETYKHKIELAVNALAAEMGEGTNLKVFGHFGITHHALYLGDRLALTPYYFSRKKRNPPVFVFEKGSYVSRVQMDLNDLEGESKELLPNRPR